MKTERIWIPKEREGPECERERERDRNAREKERKEMYGVKGMKNESDDLDLR